jgi:hypothetical protein
MHHENHERHGRGDATPSFWRSRYAIGLLAFGAIALAFLIAEHRAHVLGALPYLLLPAFVLLHVFMHAGHGSHGESREEPTPDRNGGAPPAGKPPGGTHQHG